MADMKCKDCGEEYTVGWDLGVMYCKDCNTEKSHCCKCGSTDLEWIGDDK